jgi:tRNA modification GTPase
MNKRDLPRRLSGDEARAFVASELTRDEDPRGDGPAAFVTASVKEAGGLDALEDAIESFVLGGRAPAKDSALVANVRHAGLLERALDELREAEDMTRRGETTDIIEFSVRRAWELLGEITGETAGADIVDEVFARFCLGK